jgi:putative Mg2+ transporter-C (MgtC) family protein
MNQQASFNMLSQYWSAPQVSISVVVFLNLIGSLALGFVVGYERNYRGRAAGMRTYGLVAMASCALTVVAGYPSYWFGGEALMGNVPPIHPDPTRVIQGIVTGVGFIGAGVILKEGMNISGLTTSASIWAVSAIGVMVGVGFYAAAILLAFLSAGCMMWAGKLEGLLPSRQAVWVVLKFNEGFEPDEANLFQAALRRGYEVAPHSLSITQSHQHSEWRFVAVALNRGAMSLAALSSELSHHEGVNSIQLAYTRN